MMVHLRRYENMRLKKVQHLILALGCIGLFSGCSSMLTQFPVTVATTLYGGVVDERSLSVMLKDKSIKYSILSQLTVEKGSNLINVSVESYEGEVYLIGEYELEEDKARSLEIAKSVEGVKSITAYLLPLQKGHPCGTVKNLEITAAVKQWLFTDIEVWASNVDVFSVQCNVVLSGLVGSEEEIRKSVQYAKEVLDVRGVTSYLKVSGSETALMGQVAGGEQKVIYE